MPIDFPNSPTLGQLFTAGDITRKWDGTTWSIVPTTIQGVTGATGAQGVQGISFNTGFTAKGQILVGTGNGTFNAETVGSNNQILIADSSISDGVRWADDYIIFMIMDSF